jgi:hypothetical protein
MFGATLTVTSRPQHSGLQRLMGQFQVELQPGQTTFPMANLQINLQPISSSNCRAICNHVLEL